MPASDFVYFADDAVADGTAGVPGAQGGSRLGSHLDGDFVCPCCGDHRLSLAHGDGCRFFDIDMLAALAGMDGHRRVPVVGGWR